MNEEENEGVVHDISDILLERAREARMKEYYDHTYPLATARGLMLGLFLSLLLWGFVGYLIWRVV